jgi:hypothetical protein
MQNKKENKLPFSAVSPEATGFDYFEYPELIPPNVQNVLNKYEHALVNGILYDELAQMLEDINKVGWTFEYYLDAEPYNLKPIQ